MSQHDYNIANAGGAAVRADINNALAAILSQNSGATAPTITAPNMPWFDTSTNTLKLRNAADTGWLAFADALGLATDAEIALLVALSSFTGSNQSLGAWQSASFQKFPGGLIVQMGYAATNSSGNASVTWPVTFPSNPIAVFCSTTNTVPGNLTISNGTATTTGCPFYGTGAPAGATPVAAAIGFHWFAFGK